MRMLLNDALPPEDANLDPARAVRLICDRFDFSYYAVCSVGSAEAIDSRSVLLSNFVPEGIEFLDESGWWDKFDALPKSLRSGLPIQWKLAPPSSARSVRHQQRFADLLVDYPVTECLTIPVHCGTRLGVVYFLGTSLQLAAQEISALQLAMLGLYQRLCEINPVRDLKVTPREIECLFWSSKGNTSHEVASILSISEHTVVRHLSSATRKLSAANRGQAVARAIRLGLMQ